MKKYTHTNKKERERKRKKTFFFLSFFKIGNLIVNVIKKGRKKLEIKKNKAPYNSRNA